MTGTIYLLHIEPPYKHARHYMGWTKDLDARMAEHLSGRGARLTQVILKAGCEIHLTRTWEGDRNEERRLKNHKWAPRKCPLCKQQQKEHNNG